LIREKKLISAFICVMDYASTVLQLVSVVVEHRKHKWIGHILRHEDLSTILYGEKVTGLGLPRTEGKYD